MRNVSTTAYFSPLDTSSDDKVATYNRGTQSASAWHRKVISQMKDAFCLKCNARGFSKTPTGCYFCDGRAHEEL